METYYDYIENNPILKKTFEFSLKIIKFYRQFKSETHEFSLADQVLRSATSIGANANESVVSMSQKEFISKMNISLKEAYETRYWLLLFINQVI